MNTPTLPSTGSSGVTTTEFWLTAVSGILGIFTMLGIVSPMQAAAISSQASTIIGAVMVIVPAVAYIISRLVLKHAAIVTSAPAPVVTPAPEGPAT